MKWADKYSNLIYPLLPRLKPVGSEARQTADVEGFSVRACLMWMSADLRDVARSWRTASGQDLVPDGLWEIVEPLIPPRREHPQRGGTRYVDDRAVFTAIVYVLTTDCAWLHLPAEFGVSKATAHRRSVAWTAAGARPWRRAPTPLAYFRNDFSTDNGAANRPFQPAPAARC